MISAVEIPSWLAILIIIFGMFSLIAVGIDVWWHSFIRKKEGKDE